MKNLFKVKSIFSNLKINISFLCWPTIIFFLFSFNNFGQDQIRIMSYNILNYPNVPDNDSVMVADTTARNPYFRTIFSSVNPDIVVLQEIKRQADATAFLTNVMNSYGETYELGWYGTSGDDNPIYYKADKFSLISSYLVIFAAGGHPTIEYVLYHKQTGDTLIILNTHLTAMDGAADRIARKLEADAIRARTGTYSNGANFIAMGDFNIFGAFETAYDTLLDQTNDGYFLDPLNLQNYYNWSVYELTEYNTSNTRSGPGDYLGGGNHTGLDERFDLLLNSQNVVESGGIKYKPGSFVTYGNDGFHNNRDINEQPNFSVPVDVADALYMASDHLPIYADFFFGEVLEDPPTPGGIAFTQVGADNPDVVEFITLVNMDLTKLKITNSEVDANGNLVNGDGTFDLINTPWTNIPSGTFVRLGTDLTNDNDHSDRIIQYDGAGSSPPTLYTGETGDQLIAYTGSESDPTYIAGIIWGNDGWNSVTGLSYAPGTPSDIELGTLDNYYFSGSVNGNANDARIVLTNPSNWTGSGPRIGYIDLTGNIIIENDSSLVKDIPNQTVEEGSSFTTIPLDNYVSDPDYSDSQMSWTYSGNTELTVTINSSRVATIGIPNSNWNGSETITFKATNPEGSFDTDPATFTVTPVNDPPVVTNIPDKTVTEGSSFTTITLDNYVSDPDNPDNQMTWTYSGNSELTVTINASRVATIGIPNNNWNGSETITFKATDPGGLFDTNPATFTVTPVNDPPVVTDIPNQTLEEGSSFTTIALDDFVSDLDDSDSQMIWTYSGNTELAVTINSSRVATIGVPNSNWNGSETITFRATDPGGLFDTNPATFTITPINDPPEITSTPVTGATQDVLYEYQVMAVDPDSGDVLTFSLPAAPSFLSINSTTGLISGTPENSDTGSHNITVQVTDFASAIDTQKYDLIVLNTNDPPVLTNIPDQTIAEGSSFTTISLDDYLSDPDNSDSQISWTYSGNTELTVTIDTSRIATIVIPDSNWNGSETITFKATDPGGLFDSDSAVFTVTSQNDPPVITDIPDQTIAEGSSFTTISLDDYLSDPDNSDSQMSWTYSGSTELTVTIDTLRIATIGIPDSNWNGSEIITFKATDPGGLFDSDSAKFTVTSVNDPPTITELPDTILIYNDSTYSLNIWDYIVDIETPDSLLLYEFTGIPDSLIINYNESNGYISIAGLSDFTGNVQLIFTVSDPDGGIVSDTTLVIVDRLVGVDFSNINSVPNEYRLYQNYPNPFNPNTTIKFAVSEESFIKMEVYNSLGERIEKLVDETMSAGTYTVYWNAVDLPSGIYIYRLQAGDPSPGSGQSFVETKKMVLIK